MTPVTIVAGTSSLAGYTKAGVIIARAGTQLGVLNVSPLSQATYDPFQSTDPIAVQLTELITAVGEDLATKVKRPRELTFVTAASATSYVLPTDFAGMVDQTGWDRTSQQQMYGPVSSAYTGYLKASNSTTVANIPYRVEGNLLTFPVAPGDGLTIAFEYLSNFWVQTAASLTGPNASAVTAFDDWVLYDPLLVVRGLKLFYLQAKGRDTSVAYSEYQERLESIRGRTSGGPTLSLSGSTYNQRFLDASNLPDTGYGA